MTTNIDQTVAYWKSKTLRTEKTFYQKYQIDRKYLEIIKKKHKKSNKESAKLTKNDIFNACSKSPVSRHSHCEKTANQITGFYTVRMPTEDLCQAGCFINSPNHC